jgi:hypothetical protein
VKLLLLHYHIEGQQRKAANAEAGNESNNSLPSYSGESNSIYRLGHSDTFACHNCKQKGDKWFMRKHWCRGIIVKWWSNSRQMEFGIGMELYKGCYIQYSIDDCISDMIELRIEKKES